MPLLAHGGPGRAGGGEEMGGIRELNIICKELPFKVTIIHDYSNYETISNRCQTKYRRTSCFQKVF